MAAIRTVQTKADLEKSKADNSTEAVAVQLLIELEDKQDLEVAELLQCLGNMVRSLVTFLAADCSSSKSYVWCHYGIS